MAISYDIVTIPGGRCAIAIAETDELWPRLQAAVRAYATVDLAPSEVLHHLNGLVCSGAEGRPVRCLYATLDPRSGLFAFANAGYPAPVVAAAAEGLTVILNEPSGPALGQEGIAYLQGSFILDPSSEIRFLDAEGGEAEAGLVLAASFAAASASSSASIVLPSTLGAPMKARRFSESCLSSWEVEATSSRVLGIVSELVANAVTHAGTDVEVHLRRLDRAVSIEISDTSSQLPRFGVPGALDESRRGMIIIDALSSRWGVRRTDGGKTVWAEVDDPD